MNIADTDKRIPTPRALLFEYFRLKTFQFFPGKNPDQSGLAEKSEVTFNFIKPHYKNLVKRGYYYDRLTNDVRCYFCPSILAKKEHYAEALEHEKNFSCKMALYPLNGNVPLKDEDSDSEDSFVQINYFFQSIVITKEIYKVINSRTVIDFNKRLVRSDVEILFSDGVDSDDLSNYEVRLATFDPWFPYLDGTEKPDKEKFAKAGFVYTGYSDIVMCFSCKKGLFNLEKLDDPERYHVEFYKGCSFIRENFLIVEDNANRIESINLSSVEHHLWRHPLIKNLAFRGHSKFLLKSFFTEYVNCYGCLPIDIQACEDRVEEEKIELYRRSYNYKK